MRCDKPLGYSVYVCSYSVDHFHTPGGRSHFETPVVPIWSETARKDRLPVPHNRTSRPRLRYPCFGQRLRSGLTATRRTTLVGVVIGSFIAVFVVSILWATRPESGHKSH